LAGGYNTTLRHASVHCSLHFSVAFNTLLCSKKRHTATTQFLNIASNNKQPGTL